MQLWSRDLKKIALSRPDINGVMLTKHKVAFKYATPGTYLNITTEINKANLCGFLPGFHWLDYVSKWYIDL